MKRSIPFLLAALSLINCESSEEELMICGTGFGCSTPATVRDITGLDACYGFVFELEDGTSLRPVINFYCGTPPVEGLGLDDPLHNFDFVDGKSVTIDYEVVDVDLYDACMAGQFARITCIRELQLQENDMR